ncbi:Arsenite methyltransferase [Colletotrichum shisoi]|uniref:Arsenite methyltransferase n=1 Tax=Colletotrichum shisoi TaxID=2078593 RepID=A0A5Q4C7J6_9PEZI|nr:Arsenite methyltransferase [Colletotrichum shisoi]
MDFNYETQAASSRRMYTARADKYEDSFHPDYTKRFMAVADVRSGEHVLILACGTGLEVFAAAERVGEEGEIIGVDVTEAMLAKAREKQGRLNPSTRIRLFNHDATRLETLPELDGQAFDVILCSSAFVLFDDPGEVVRSWRRYLKPEGRLVVDARGQPQGRVAAGARGEATRRAVPEQQVLDHGQELVYGGPGGGRLSGQGDTTYDMDQVDEQFDWITGTSLTVNLATEEFKRKTRDLFREEWEKAAVDGKVVNVDAVYVYVARRA